ncbi:MAG: hypothetical protein ACREBD_27560 [Blastocatellia bacterium]
MDVTTGNGTETGYFRQAIGSASVGLGLQSSEVLRLPNNYSATAVSFAGSLPDLVCLSHLRWDAVYQRPQHLMSRCAFERRVYFVEEPVFSDSIPRLEISRRNGGVLVVVPHLPLGLSDSEAAVLEQSLLLDELFLEYAITDYILWYYTPMAIAFTWHLEPLTIVYDCLDELSASKDAPQNINQREAELLMSADLVFTEGYSLYEAKRRLHPNVHPFPNSLDSAAWDSTWARMMELINLTVKKHYPDLFVTQPVSVSLAGNSVLPGSD